MGNGRIGLGLPRFEVGDPVIIKDKDQQASGERGVIAMVEGPMVSVMFDTIYGEYLDLMLVLAPEKPRAEIKHEPGRNDAAYARSLIRHQL
ncbi:MAG TPA: hypothetical protein VH855_20415 [Acetobacteraceae bacterium]|jgi:hypothetical protein